MFSEALSIYFQKFPALILTCALALVPSSLVMSGAVVLGFATLSEGGVSDRHAPHGPPAPTANPSPSPEKTPAPEASAMRMQPAAPAATGEITWGPHLIRTLLPMTFALFCAVLVLLTGLSLAQAALTPLALHGASGPARAWAVVASRFPALIWTALQSVPLIALGTLLFALPGIVLAVGFAFAMPVVMAEGLAGRAALERSWVLGRGRRAQIFALLLLLGVFIALGTWVSTFLPVGPWRAVVSGAVRLITLPLPLLWLVLLYQRAVSTSAGSPLLDSSARGSPGTPRP